MTRPRLLVALLIAALAAAALLILREDLDVLRRGDPPLDASAVTGIDGDVAAGRSASRPKSIADVTGIRVAVTDDSGRPLAGCPVRLVGRPQAGAPFVLAETASGADGAALLEPDVETCLEEAAGGVTFAVALGIVADAEFESPVDPIAPPRDPVVLRAPPLGAVRIELRMCDRTLPKRSCEVELRSVDPAAPWGPLTRTRITKLTVEEGAVRWPWIAAGTLVHAMARWPGLGIWSSTTGTPEAAGDEVLLAITIIKGPSRITGRVLDAAGVPVAGRDLEIVVKRARHYQPVVRPVTTTATGTFEADVPNLLEEPFVVTLVKQSNGSIEAGTEERELPATCADEVAAGDFVLNENPLLVAGRVIDERGSPIAAAEVFVLLAQAVGPEFHVYTNPGGYAFKTVSDDAGAFSVHGSRKSTHIVVGASKEGYSYPPGLPFEDKVPAGTSTVEIKMRKDSVRPGSPSSIGALVVTLGPGSRPLAGSLEVRIQDEARPAVAPVRGTFDAGGVARFKGAPAGTVEVHLASALQPEKALVTIPGVKVPSGGESEDPRLVDVEVPGAFRVIDLVIVTDGGDPPAEAEVRTEPSGLGMAPLVKVRDGRARLVLSDSPLMCEVSAAGMQPAVVSVAAGATTVTLAAAIHLTAKIAAHPRIPAAVQLGVSMRLAKPAIRLLDADRRRDERITATFDHEGVLRHDVAVPGVYVARWVVVGRGDRGPITCFVTGAEPFKLTVPESGETAELAFECPVKLVEAEAKKLPRPERR